MAFQNDLSESLMRQMAKDVGSSNDIVFHDVSAGNNVAWKRER